MPGLEDEKDFIKHLAHVAKELKLGKYVMDNPDFVPDVMSQHSESWTSRAGVAQVVDRALV